MGWPSKNHRDYVDEPEAPASVFEPRSKPTPALRPSSVTETFTVRASRFSINALESGIERVSTRLGLRVWITIGSGRLRRDLKITVAGEPQAIADLVAYIESLREGSGDAPGPMM